MIIITFMITISLIISTAHEVDHLFSPFIQPKFDCCHYYIGIQPICRYEGEFFKMVADLEIFKCLYLFSLTSYGLITGLADFPFTERCYWYLQSTLNPCLIPTPLSVEKPDFPDFLLFLSFFLLSSFFFQPSYLCPIRAS